MDDFTEKACLCALNRIFGYEPKMATGLISHLGSAREVFNLSGKDIEHLTGAFFKYQGQICRQAVETEMRELESLHRQGISFCGWSEDCYPSLLKECEDPPVGLYVRSATPPEELWKPLDSIAVVGTRDISPYGREWCGRIVSALSRCREKPVIVSGLALGTDITAHQKALDCGLPTIGVMATGPESIYPWRNREVAERIVRTPGCALVTDYPPGTAPVALNFLRRNRIIAGLSRATLLIESKIRGGGMMTCRLAYSYNREVYALPGRVDDIRSQGCNDLIRRKIAEPITSERELITSLGFRGSTRAGRPDLESILTSEYESRLPSGQISIIKDIVRAIKSDRDITVDLLPERLGVSFQTVAELVGMLEIDGFISVDLLKRCSINYKNV